MKAISFGLAAALAIVLFGTVGSIGATAPRSSVGTRVVSMYAVLPGGMLVDLGTAVTRT